MPLNNPSKLSTFISLIIALPAVGLLYDAMNGFAFIKQANSIYALLVGIFATGLFVLIGEYLFEKIFPKNEQVHSFLQKALRLFAYVLAIILFVIAYWYILKIFGLSL